MATTYRLHEDPALQPERTILSWSRTILVLCVVSSLFLRWYPDVGLISLAPAVGCVVAGLVIQLTQRHRYALQSRGIVRGQVEANLIAVGLMTALVVAVAGLGLMALWL
ncbi:MULTISPECIES: DUF202 domain-containing protein [Auritidibacter]|uniref:DUF202 domain-containing protein n=1 Tax=Auritidibacter ignavus TaxID=678932 RepID=A0AAJ6AJ23_9MICC|nr:MULTISPECIES: DUF202 domain-containing protein [Auritidibacter]PXA82546.1 hypothetical protein DCC26_00205 [Auritidibacter sp. NML120779]AXR75109.1 DUF202 domain-containing protein [Auritidibacter sp. NML130574]NIH71874.1 uncharacterized membrane protein YidH (DUF202 family) [Auritidibacter ignavus]PXA76320.1 hypothetical protein DCC24_08045 [Auritidibacter sp. NML100628]PXA79597.1 hypothetical protein DCC25_08610 [Auritidibacter sp. NML120636]